ncbi:amidase [Georgenia satyanarayanai]|uniref:amidase n=1 Tax=Georgenia satyanarayanai TaxID=860221 RepID=UPI0012656340|nr:amidase [Georgenia satyanarayanai]
MHRRRTTTTIAAAAIVPTVILTLLAGPASAAPPPPDDSLVTEATIASIHEAFADGDMSCTDLVQAYVDRIETYDAETTNAVQVVNEEALATAAELDAAYAEDGLSGPLHCVPVLVKDQVETADMPTTYGSAIFSGFESGRDATIVARMRDAGAVMLAKTNMGEYASGWAGSAFGVCRNPYDLTRAASSSSCGTGAAVAANYGAVGIAEDTGGSTRGPAAWNNAVGLRPTTPLISRYGMMPANPSYDTLGPLTRTVEDAAIVTSVIAGPDANDPLTAQAEGHVAEDYAADLSTDALEGTRIGVIREPQSADTDTGAPDYARVRAVVDAAYADMERLGAEVVEVEVPNLRALLAAYSTGGAETEAATNAYLAALAEIADPPVSTFEEIATSPLVTPTRQASLRALLGRTTEDADYVEGEQMRQQLRDAVTAVMEENELDAVAYATFDHEAPVIPADQLTNPDAMAGVRQGSNRSLAPVTGFPALAVPAGFTTTGLPVGIDLLGLPWSEKSLFELAYAYEQGTGHRTAPVDFPALDGEPGTTPAPQPSRSPVFHLSNDWRGTTAVSFPYGRSTDEVLIGDWDGDGTDSVTVRRGNRFHVSNAARGGDADVVLTYGRPGDVVLVGDWDGDGTDTFAVRRGATYHVKNSLRGGDADTVLSYGRTTDAVTVGDWDGDGTDTFAVRRGATYHVKNSLRGGDADTVFTYGRAADVTLTGDWDGDGLDTFAVQRGRTFHVSNALRGGSADVAVTFGRLGDEVYVGDWDGNGTDTLGIRRTPGSAG